MKGTVNKHFAIHGRASKLTLEKTLHKPYKLHKGEAQQLPSGAVIVNTFNLKWTMNFSVPT